MEGDSDSENDGICCKISIHALRVEGDQADRRCARGGGGFLSTPSGWRATIDVAIDDRHCARISIHALRVEGDFL